MTWTETKSCRGCSSTDLTTVLDLGQLPLVNEYHPIGSSLPTQCYPHQIRFCQRCGMAQQSGALSREEVFPSSYPYSSSTTRALRENFAQLFEESQRINPLGKGDLAIDIGGNDGNLLSNWVGTCRTLNVTPEDMGKLGVERGVEHWQAYWGSEVANVIQVVHGPAKLITATNVMAHCPDPHSFLSGVQLALAPGGVFISESHYLPELLRGCQFDACYLEHDRLLSLQSIRHQLAAHDFVVIGARSIPTHGGSIRVYAMREGEARPHIGSDVEPRDDALYGGAVTLADFATFRERVAKHRHDLRRLLSECRSLGLKVAGLGAPSRASTLVSYCGLSTDDLDCVYEAPGSHKLGRYMPGTRIEIRPEPEVFSDGYPDVLLLLSHHVGHELSEAVKLKGFRGKFIWPLPEVSVE